jgi:hypothetical protein
MLLEERKCESFRKITVFFVFADQFRSRTINSLRFLSLSCVLDDVNDVDLTALQEETLLELLTEEQTKKSQIWEQVNYLASSR